MADKLINPVFSGNPDELKSFVDNILADMTEEQLAYYAYTKYASESVETAYGFQLPPSAVGGYDAIGGVDTDFPMPIHIGQSWDRNLTKRMGQVKGDERRGKFALSNPNTLMFTGLVDMRINPLAGRIYESFGEDPHLVGSLAYEEAEGVKGDDSFYLKTQVVTKHFSSYGAEWDRKTKTNFSTARFLREYYFASTLEAMTDEAFQGVMTAFGAINGVPYSFSPYLRVLQENRKYALFSVSDFNGDYDSLHGMGKGYDTVYAKNGQQVAGMLTKARSYSNNDDATAVVAQDTVDAVTNGVFGLTRRDLEEQIRPQIELWVRSGYFNQSEYPYADLCADGTPVTAEDENSQAVALETAQSGIVLLKNSNNALPLSKNDTAIITGMFSEYRTKAWYSIETPSNVPHAGETLATALKNAGGQITHAGELSGSRFKVKSVLTGNYVTANADDTVTANEASADNATIFQLFDWGQQGYSFYDPATNKYLYMDYTSYPFKLHMLAYDDITTSIRPTVFTWETDDAGHVLSRIAGIPSDPIVSVLADKQFYEYWNQNGNYMSIDESDTLTQGPAIGETLTDASWFEVETVSAVGDGVDSYVENNEYAIVAIGSNSFVNASETTDRKNLNLGQEQLTLVNKVSEQYPGKTIVVLNSNLPLAVKEIQDNENVAAILYTGYAGQFESTALAQTIYGEVTPSGKLTVSWLKDLSTLPPLTADELAEGIDDTYSVDMKNVDASQLKLTYLYNEASDLIYEFGYGLSYTEFTYSDFSITEQASTNDDIVVNVTITNSGNYSGREVVQIYARSDESCYGTYVPNKQLIAYLKTETLAPGESKSYHIAIAAERFAKWDVTSSVYIVEAGEYQIMVGASCQKILYNQQINILGDEIGTLDLKSARNVWNSSYSSTKAIKGIEVSKKRTAEFAEDYFAVLSGAAEDYVILPNVNIGNATAFEVSVASTNESSTIEVYSGSMSTAPVCSFTFGPTDATSYYLDEAQTMPVEELSYTTLTQDLTGTVGVKDDLYIVFKSADIRIDTIKAI